MSTIATLFPQFNSLNFINDWFMHVWISLIAVSLTIKSDRIAALREFYFIFNPISHLKIKKKAPTTTHTHTHNLWTYRSKIVILVCSLLCMSISVYFCAYINRTDTNKTLCNTYALCTRVQTKQANKTDKQTGHSVVNSYDLTVCCAQIWNIIFA